MSRTFFVILINNVDILAIINVIHHWYEVHVLMEKRRLLWISDSPGVPTGNGKITRHFVHEMRKSDKYSVAVLGRGYTGWPGEREKYGCTIYPMDMGRPYPELMQAVSREYQPHVVVSCMDMWQIDWIEHAKQSNAVTNIGYISIYGKPVPLSWKKVVKNLDLAICYSEFGRGVLREFMPFSSIDMIHLGVDINIYKPLNNKEKLKLEYGCQGKFVVGCISRNQSRKRLDKLIEGFARFASAHDDALLVLKTEPVSEHGYHLPDLIERYNLNDKVTIIENKNRNWHSEEKLAELFNTFDLYVQTAGAEGFGMPILEAMACGIPVIAPDYSACSELIQENGLTLKPRYPRIVDLASVEQVSVDTCELAEKLDMLYNDQSLRKKLGEKGRSFSLNLTWKHFIDRWHEVFSRIQWN